MEKIRLLMLSPQLFLCREQKKNSRITFVPLETFSEWNNLNYRQALEECGNVKEHKESSAHPHGDWGTSWNLRAGSIECEGKCVC